MYRVANIPKNGHPPSTFVIPHFRRDNKAEGGMEKKLRFVQIFLMPVPEFDHCI